MEDIVPKPTIIKLTITAIVGIVREIAAYVYIQFGVFFVFVSRVFMGPKKRESKSKSK